jgi:anhydro-N-acetylmuramic acid kinase
VTLYAGLISGTSMDGVEAVLMAADSGRFVVRAATHTDYPAALRAELLDVVADPARCDLDRFGALDVAVGRVFAEAAASLFAKAGVAPQAVRAIGSHGQTILHRPRQALPFTLQVGDPHQIAEVLGVDVVADFRRRDMAAGGEAAPLAPGFHAAVFGSPQEDRAVANLGGIANITWLPVAGSVTGFDTGPANCLMDLWAQRHLGTDYDRDGAFAAAGRVDATLLARLLDEPYLALPAPKSTGRELFRMPWLEKRLAALPPLAPADVQATLCEYSAATLCDALVASGNGRAPARLLVCGGGAYNRRLMERVSARLPTTVVESTAAHGIPPEQVEGALFAWLAWCFVEGRAGNLPAVTGARGPRPLGMLCRGGVTKP